MGIIEEDDEFDWEAAVREIDVACRNSSKPSASPPPQGTLPPSSTSHFARPVDASFVNKNHSSDSCSNNVKKPASCKQSTLDKFVARAGPRPPSENQTVEVRPDECFIREDKLPCVDIDRNAAKTWIFPVNVPLRDYQYAITKTALFSNTLVALPTGLGKTLIAAVVMYNYFRWFPEGKIVFAAPSRPLVMQQIEACHNIAGIPQEWAIDMTGQTSPSKRAIFWQNKRVFFVTPQVFEKDIQSGACPVNFLVCLVIDEAHKASGNFAYCVAVRELMAVPVQMRILALTATPGSKAQAIQGIIDNLCISTLEYRNESDHDVSPYVHKRKVELIEVPLGQDAVEINKRLLDVMCPYVSRLHSLGLVQNRDCPTLSTCYLVDSRDKFRQAPPPGLPQVKYGVVESCFAVLISLYYIRKLLLSHGIRPAFEMLERKLEHGPFARSMSKDEDFMKAKLLMQQNLNHGAPSPKLSKMLEVLVDHFKTKDPNTSRVIIFSNYRESVRDIMNALSSIGDLVKANEFIGQSSGKALKGQSQKVQQAVLEKFRAGGYNVIVATSIAEEGLDIMEVDLVICFDANVSPLRMIQRMGRTGRKHDGRVVVLACEGSELKGYMRKQANGRSIRKHMRNGGTNSFNFHPSPRMIPHIFKPEVQFIELSIDQFIPRGKKPKDGNVVEMPHFPSELTPAETDLLRKYFCHNSENTWRPSLIAFPHFQAIPSKVNKVKHSYRTRMFIDAMQCLQEATFSEQSKSFFTEMQDETVLGEREGFNAAEPKGGDRKDYSFFDDVPLDKSQRNVSEPAASPISTLEAKENYGVPGLHVEEPPTHCYLFGPDFVSVDSLGKVFIMPVPLLTSSAQDCKCQVTTDTCPSSLKQHSCPMENSNKSHYDQIIQDKGVDGPMISQIRYVESDTTSASGKFKFQQEKLPCGSEEIQTLRKNLLNEEENSDEMVEDAKIKILTDEDDYGDPELSPRLTNFIKSGVVPESPISDQGIVEEKRRGELLFPSISSPTGFSGDLIVGSPGQERRENKGWGSNPANTNGGHALPSSTSHDMQTPPQKMKTIGRKRDCTSASPVPEEWKTPLANLTNISCSMDWRLSSGDKSENARHASKLKRLRKVGDCARNSSTKAMKEITDNPAVNYSRSLSHAGPPRKKHMKGKKKRADDVRAFIDEEAEVSSEAEMSADEEDNQGNNSYEASFIDDRENPTASTPADSSKVDMMAIYRRSLLSQSPLTRRLHDFGTSSPDSVVHITRINESGSSSGKSVYSLQTNSADQSAGRNSISSQRNQDKTSAGAGSCPDIGVSEENKKKMVSRKRRFSTGDSGYVPVINLEEEFSVQAAAAAARHETLQRSEADKTNASGDLFDDDTFYAAIDFDAVEAQATLLLRQKSDSTVQMQDAVLHSDNGNVSLQTAPSFDLGFW